MLASVITTRPVCALCYAATLSVGLGRTWSYDRALISGGDSFRVANPVMEMRPGGPWSWACPRLTTNGPSTLSSRGIQWCGVAPPSQGATQMGRCLLQGLSVLGFFATDRPRNDPLGPCCRSSLAGLLLQRRGEPRRIAIMQWYPATLKGPPSKPS